MPVLDADSEDLRVIDAQHMLGADVREYLLVDTPGPDDSDLLAHKNAQKVHRVCGHMILVLDFARPFTEVIKKVLCQSKGRAVLPVVFDEHYQDRTIEARDEQKKAIIAALEAHAPHHEHQSVIFLPKDGDLNKTDWDQLHEGIKALLLCRQVDPSALARNLYLRFKGDLKNMLGEFPERALEPVKTIQRQQEQTLKKVAIRILGNDRQLKAGVRLHMLRSVTQDCPVICFPFRTFVGTLGIMAGAWDRIWFAAMGSLPSLAGLALQTGKNLTAMREARELRWNAVLQSTQDQVYREMRDPLDRLARIIPGGKRIPAESVPFRVVGMEHMRDFADELLLTAGSSSFLRRTGIGLLGGITTALWIALAAGPIWSIYQEFINAWKQSAFTDGSWQAFPVPSLGMIASTLFLVFTPVVFFAMIGLGMAVKRKRVDTCVLKIQSDYESTIKDAMKNRLLHLECTHPLLDAAIALLVELEFMDKEKDQ